ncbi:hypothetical protein [Aurantimonas sp. HBX-1]|uniref:hypothetical protein n=1 Tax=Aurantimonas sp. HBX-1 TaxID=2906072 RepID=UPI001F307E31|nr:hypothetical protein [Aurantimonas sp. HBX-1]UIJ72914.1 hypothetical protein LXB15_04455 [Aurantimonas sp. HBX-1]
MSNTGNDDIDPILAADIEVGGDADQPGISQPVTQAEIDDILNSPDMLVEEKQARLEELARQVGYRETIDQGDEFDPLGLQISEALNLLAQGGHNYSTVEETGFDPEGRSDARSPDDADWPEDPDAPPR